MVIKFSFLLFFCLLTSLAYTSEYPKPWTEIGTVSDLKEEPPPTKQFTKEQEDIMHKEMLDLVNQFRRKNAGRQALKIDTDLDVAAKIQADYIAAKNQLSHYQTKIPEYETPTTRVAMIKTGDYKVFYTVGENVAFTSYEPEAIENPEYIKKIALELFESWRASKIHRENMLDREYQHFGFAVTLREDTRLVYAVQVFSVE